MRIDHSPIQITKNLSEPRNRVVTKFNPYEPTRLHTQTGERD